jgi:hypothetical protein
MARSIATKGRAVTIGGALTWDVQLYCARRRRWRAMSTDLQAGALPCDVFETIGASNVGNVDWSASQGAVTG